MVGLWISAGAMVLMVALLLFEAFRHARKAPFIMDATADLAVYRDQLAEVVRDQNRGVLAASEAERLRLEIHRRMLDVDRPKGAEVLPHQGSTLWIGVGALVLCLGAGIAIYGKLGLPGFGDLPLSTRLAAADDAYNSRLSQDQAEAAQPPFSQPTDIDPELSAMIDKLRDAVATRPDDLLGHSLLAQNEAALGNFVAARKAQGVVVRLKRAEATAEDLATLAQLMVAAAGGMVTPEAEKVLVQCLKLDPGNGWARYYSGLMFAEIGRPDRAFSLWEPLMREGPNTAPWVKPISSLIVEVAAASGVNYSLPDAGPDAAEIAAASELSATDRKAMIKSKVAGLEERLMADGGTVEEWAKLITSLGVLMDRVRAKVIYAKAQEVFAGQPGELAALKAAAVEAGVAP